MTKPIFSIIIPAYNEENYIAGCLDSVLNQDFDRSLYEVIVINNASTDKTRSIALSRAVNVINEEKKGYVFALIKGVNFSKGDILVFTDADCRVPFDWLSKIYQNFQKHPEIDGVGGVFSVFDIGPVKKNLLDFAYRHIADLNGGNMAIKRDKLNRLGGFDPKVNLGADVNISRKIKECGKITIDQGNVVFTSGRRFSKSFIKEPLFQAVNYYFLKLFKKPLLFNFRDIRTIGSPFNFIRYVKYSFVTASFLVTFLIALPSAAISQNFFLNNAETNSKVVLLTIDNGPDPETTPLILKVLKEKNIKAAFFVVGSKVKQYPQLTKKIIQDGHILGNRSYTNRWYAGLKIQSDANNDFITAEKEINDIASLQPKFIRVPGGIASFWLASFFKKHGYLPVGGNINSQAWYNNIKTDIFANNIRPGSIIVFKEEMKKKNKEQIVKDLSKTIENIEKQGYKFISLTEFLKTEAYFNSRI